MREWRGKTWWLRVWNYSFVSDRKEWGFVASWGGTIDRELEIFLHKYSVEFACIRLADCFEWERQYLGVEKGRGVVYQDRICGFREWPIRWGWKVTRRRKTRYDGKTNTLRWELPDGRVAEARDWA